MDEVKKLNHLREASASLLSYAYRKKETAADRVGDFFSELMFAFIKSFFTILLLVSLIGALGLPPDGIKIFILYIGLPVFIAWPLVSIVRWAISQTGLRPSKKSAVKLDFDRGLIEHFVGEYGRYTEENTRYLPISDFCLVLHFYGSYEGASNLVLSLAGLGSVEKSIDERFGFYYNDCESYGTLADVMISHGEIYERRFEKAEGIAHDHCLAVAEIIMARTGIPFFDFSRISGEHHFEHFQKIMDARSTPAR